MYDNELIYDNNLAVRNIGFYWSSLSFFRQVNSLVAGPYN